MQRFDARLHQPRCFIIASDVRVVRRFLHEHDAPWRPGPRLSAHV